MDTSAEARIQEIVSNVEDCRKEITSFQEKLDGYLTKLDQLQKERKSLMDQGVFFNASEWWKNDTYLYLTFPSEGSKRVREYVGNKSEAIAEARQKVQRGNEVQRIDGEIDKIGRRVYSILHRLEYGW